MDEKKPNKQVTTSRRNVIAAERRKKAFEMRKSGLDYGFIAGELGVSRPACHQMVKKELELLRKTTHELAIDHLDMELSRLDRLLFRMWSLALGGEYQAVDKVLKIMERRAKLLGLDAPQKLAPTTPSGESEWNPTIAKNELASILGIPLESLPE